MVARVLKGIMEVRYVPGWRLENAGHKMEASGRGRYAL